jgi:hypothetical protein
MQQPFANPLFGNKLLHQVIYEGEGLNIRIKGYSDAHKLLGKLRLKHEPFVTLSLASFFTTPNISPNPTIKSSGAARIIVALEQKLLAKPILA